jgi:hypothetical protein
MAETPGIPSDWKQPVQVEQEKAWNRLEQPERERLADLRGERSAERNPVWESWLEPDPDDPEEFVIWILKPVDPRDPRPTPPSPGTYSPGQDH